MEERRRYSACAVANEFLRIARLEQKTLTNMQVQKLVFLANGYCLALTGSPLYYHNTHAWQWGPVIPQLYKALQKYGNNAVTDDLSAPDAIAPEDTEAFGIIRGVWRGYGNRSGFELSSLTHQQGSPWWQTWEKDQFGIIPAETIAAYYKKLVGEA